MATYRLQSKNKRALNSLALFLPTIAAYAICCFIAYLLYPTGFSPDASLVEELGNPLTNPAGSLYYNIGMLVVNIPVFILVGLQMAGGKKLTASYDKIGKITFYLTGLFLVLFVSFSVLSLLTPMGVDSELNGLLGNLMLLAYELFVVSYIIGVVRERGHVRWEPALGIAVIIANIALFGLMLIGFPIAEWIMYVLCWSYIVVFLYEIA